MELPYGVSGFYHSDEPKPPDMEVGKYKKLCDALANELNGELTDFNDSLYPANFHKAHFKFPEREICLLMNKHYPLLAFAVTVETMKIEFLDFPQGAQVIPDEYSVLPVAALAAKVTEQMGEKLEHELNKGTVQQIRYWKPETVGQIIFNFWD